MKAEDIDRLLYEFDVEDETPEQVRFAVHDLTELRASAEGYSARFQIDYGEMIEWGVRSIIRAIKHNSPPSGDAFSGMYVEALSYPVSVWESLHANIEQEEVDLVARARLLDLCRRWFTEMLHVSVGKQPMFLALTENKFYRDRP